MSPDGAQIAAADADGSASIMEAATGADVHSFRMAAGTARRSRWPTVQTDDCWRVRVKTARKLISGTRKRTIDRPG